MPTLTVTVQRVYPRKVKTRFGWREKFDIFTDAGAFETWNVFAASICDRSRALGKPVSVTYKDAPKWGRDIVDVKVAA